VSVPLRHIIDSLKNQRVLVVGDVMLDEYLTGDCSRISPEAPVPVLTVSGARTVLGGAANTANNIASLGGRAALIGLVGADDAARRLSEETARFNIEFVPVVDVRPTVRKVRVVGQQQQLLRMDYETAGTISAEAEAGVVAAAEREVPKASVVVISDYAKGCLNERLTQTIIRLANAHGKPVVVDPRPQHASYYAGCDFMTPNWKESRGLLGLPEVPITPAAVDETGRLIAATFGAHALLTLGARGMKLFGRDGVPLLEEPALAREVFDVSGAGDTVVAAFSLALAGGSSLAEAVGFANRAAGIVVAKLGTATVTPAELLRDAAPTRALVSRPELEGLASRLRSQGRRIVTLNGSFDILHAGHLHFIREARKQGDVLLVGVNSDASVRSNKGPSRPFVGQEDRARMLLALRDVDYVHVFDEPTPMTFLELIRPDVHVNGSEYGADCIEAPTVRAHGGRVHIVEKVPGLSTSELVARIQSRAATSAV
jgi:D-beta-D-heptose 7-phosphate kinase/D-beta-D-heptose 1-phosphate adenosyltransferase